MSARDAILKAVREARPAGVALPDVDAARSTFPSSGQQLDQRFIDAARVAGSEVVACERAMLEHLLNELAPDSSRCVCEAVLGVAENGAVWLPLSRLGARAPAFLAEHVVVVLDRTAIVSDLHEAYDSIDVAGEVFGVFVAGPSKTADIEQSLVIGAQGPKRLTLVLV